MTDITQAAQVTLAGQTFTVVKLDAITSMKLMGKLSTVLAPVIGDAITAFGTTNVASVDKQKLVADILAIFPRLDMDAATDLIIELCQTARFNSGPMVGQPVDFNTAFNDDLEAALLLAFEVCKLNFAKYVKGFSQTGTAQQSQDDSKNS